MVKILYSCCEVNLSHAQMVLLRKTGRLNLAIDDTFAAQISDLGWVGPKKTAATAAFHFWNFITLGVLGWSIYASFTSDWWWFIAGVSGAGIMFKVNKKSNSENLLKAAMIDDEFYERVREFGGWLYQMEESEADKYQ